MVCRTDGQNRSDSSGAMCLLTGCFICYKVIQSQSDTCIIDLIVDEDNLHF